MNDNLLLAISLGYSDIRRAANKKRVHLLIPVSQQGNLGNYILKNCVKYSIIFPVYFLPTFKKTIYHISSRCEAIDTIASVKIRGTYFII